MTKYEVRPATIEDVCELAKIMKQHDVDELWAFSRHRPLGALQISLVLSSEAFTGLIDGRVVMMFGIGAPSLLSKKATPWMLSSEELFDPQHVRYFLREGKRWTKTMMLMYPEMSNWVDARSKATVKWLKWLGFTVDKPQPMGRDETLFHRFHYTMPGLYGEEECAQ